MYTSRLHTDCCFVTLKIVRKALIRINGGRHFSKYAPSVLLINGFIVFVSAAAIGSAAYPASIQGDAFVVIHKAYTGLQAMIAQAKATGDLALLASFETYAAGLGRLSS